MALVTTTPAVDLKPALPRELQVEVTGSCNLRCQMCLVRYRPPIDRVSGSLTLADLEALVDSLPDLERLTLQGLGEPLLVPDLVDMVAMASGRGIRVGFNTNGTLLTERKGEALIDAGLSWLCVSLDGATADTFETIRDGANFDRVVRNLRRFADLKARLGADHPEVRVVFVAMRRNVHELPALVELAAGCGVHSVRVQNLSHTFDDCDPAGEFAGIRVFAEREALWQGAPSALAAEAFDAAGSVAAELDVDLRLPSLDPEPPQDQPSTTAVGCDWPWREAYVTHEGDVQPCCMVMGSDRATLGNIRDESFAEVWHGDAYVQFRAGLAGQAPVPEVCRGCSLYRGCFSSRPVEEADEVWLTPDG